MGKSAVTGFSSQVRLGDRTGQIYQSNKVLMIVRLTDPDGPVQGSGPQRYMRGETYNAYKDSTWSKWHIGLATTSLETLPPISEKILTESLTQTVSMDTVLQPYMFTLYPPLQGTCHNAKIALKPDLSAKLRFDGVPPPHVSYQVKTPFHPLSVPVQEHLSGLHAMSKALEPTDPSITVEAQPAVQHLAHQWCHDLLKLREAHPAKKDALDRQIADRLAENLMRRCDYTLDLSGANPEQDGVEDFLFHTKQGHCEYFASAHVVMCRALGVRARLVAGFLLEEYDKDNQYYIVRGRDAHAWAEVFTPSSDWVIVDPTPSSGRQIHGQTWGAGPKRWWAHWQFLWLERVVGYDANARQSLWQGTKRVFENLGALIGRATTACLRSSWKLLLYGSVDWVLVRLAIAVGLVGLVLESLLIWRWLRRAFQRRRHSSQPLPLPVKQLKFIRQLMSLLEDRTFHRRPEQTPREFVAEAAQRLETAPQIMTDLVNLYYRVRWGFEVPTAAEILTAEQQVAKLAETLRG